MQIAESTYFPSGRYWFLAWRKHQVATDTHYRRPDMKV